MYKLFRTLNQSHKIDKCREAHKNGKGSIEERMIYGTKRAREKMLREILLFRAICIENNLMIEISLTKNNSGFIF